MRAKDVVLRTVTFQEPRRESIEETKKNRERGKVKQMGLHWVSHKGREFLQVKEHKQLSYPFRFSPNSMGSGCHFKSQSQLWFSGSALGHQGPT